jgi:opacity protein-like surface antigen
MGGVMAMLRVGMLRWASAVLLLIAAPAAWAADGDERRYYLSIRYAESAPWSRAHDAVGVSLGVNLGRYVGAELAGDFYELFVDVPGEGKVGELGTGTIIPQLRLRYPLLDDRLVPYVLGGAGAALTQFNDRTVRAGNRPIRTDDAAFVGSMGAGLEYFFTDEIALGVDFKYLLSTEQTVQVGRRRFDMDLDASMLGFSMRMLYPEIHPSPRPLAARGLWRFYFGVKGGGAMPVHERVFGEIEQRPEDASIGPFNQIYGLVLGVNIGRYLAVELPFEGYEMQLHQPGVGDIGEYAVYDFVPQVRARYPLLPDRLETYAVGGVGGSYGLFNEKSPAGRQVPAIDAEDFGIGATLGAGLEYFVTRNVAIGGEARYLFARGHTFQYAGSPAVDGDLDSLYITIGLRLFLFEAGEPRGS